MSSWKSIVVGVDGSPQSKIALNWAATEAADHGAELVVLQVWEKLPVPATGAIQITETDVSEAVRPAGDDLVALIKEELGETPAVLVRPAVKQGNAAQLLIEEATGADLLVVGTRGHGGFAGLLLGSVSQHVAAYASCPVAVIR